MANNKPIYKNLILNEDEIIIKIIRQSILKLTSSLSLPIILIILPFFFLYLLFSWGNFGIAIFSVILLVGILWLTRALIVWYFQTFIITNQRIIDVDQKGMFQKTVSDIPLTKIQDIFYQTQGIWQTLAKTGNISIVLPDSKTKIEIKNVAQPHKLQQLILQLRADTLKEKLDSTKLSAQELVALVKKIKAGIGEEKFNEIIGQTEERRVEED
ncbi:MAG: PH domain-containing protein [Patescibacteria group bacterium]|jgi:uncharacterized membrane protein YdbT with pleckstrin-like domain